jgi:hypothetical protein
MSAAAVVAVSLPTIVVIALLIAAVFVSARIHRREPGPTSTRRWHADYGGDGDFGRGKLTPGGHRRFRRGWISATGV